MVLKIWEGKFVTAHFLRTYVRTEDKLDSFLTLVKNGDKWLAVHPGRFNLASMEPDGASTLELTYIILSRWKPLSLTKMGPLFLGFQARRLVTFPITFWKIMQVFKNICLITHMLYLFHT